MMRLNSNISIHKEYHYYKPSFSSHKTEFVVNNTPKCIFNRLCNLIVEISYEPFGEKNWRFYDKYFKSIYTFDRFLLFKPILFIKLYNRV